MASVVVVDYGMGNLDSVRRALEECGARVLVSGDPGDLATAERVVLPGVGAFPDAMRNLTTRGLGEALTKQVIDEGVPILGICLGMQLTARLGHEIEPTPGLGWIDAEVVRMRPAEEAERERVPHIGWNEVVPVRDDPLFDGIPSGADFYFVHSFHVACADSDDVIATTPYCGGFVAAFARGNVAGVQFHPEKSQHHGLVLLRNFLSWCVG